MWMSGNHVEINVRATATRITIPLRHAIEAFREPTRVTIHVDGVLAEDVVLDTPEWQPRTIALTAATVPFLSRLHRVKIAIDHPWRPADIIRGSMDGRILGIQIGMVTVE
jgi:hypothetical protein